MHDHLGHNVTLGLVNNLHVGIDEIVDNLDLPLQLWVTVVGQLFILSLEMEKTIDNTSYLHATNLVTLQCVHLSCVNRTFSFLHCS